jgi:hypothetical protein
VGREHVAVVGAQFGDQRRDVLGELVSVGRIVSAQYLADSGDLGGSLCNGPTTFARNQHVDVATDCLGRSQNHQRGRLEFRVIVIGYNEDAHEITFASFFSLSTSSSTVSTLIPASRSEGGSTDSTSTVGVRSTPRSSGETTSSGFFFAFMMLGSDA